MRVRVPPALFFFKKWNEQTESSKAKLRKSKFAHKWIETLFLNSKDTWILFTSIQMKVLSIGTAGILVEPDEDSPLVYKVFVDEIGSGS